MKIFNLLILIISVVLIFFLAGCSGGSDHSTVYYESYFDPYPYWGYGDETTIIIERPDKPNRPSPPPGLKPPGIGRPKLPGRRR